MESNISCRLCELFYPQVNDPEGAPSVQAFLAHALLTASRRTHPLQQRPLQRVTYTGTAGAAFSSVLLPVYEQYDVKAMTFTGVIESVDSLLPHLSGRVRASYTREEALRLSQLLEPLEGRRGTDCEGLTFKFIEKTGASKERSPAVLAELEYLSPLNTASSPRALFLMERATRIMSEFDSHIRDDPSRALVHEQFESVRRADGYFCIYQTETLTDSALVSSLLPRIEMFFQPFLPSFSPLSFRTVQMTPLSREASQ